jgi:hypothetical protein
VPGDPLGSARQNRRRRGRIAGRHVLLTLGCLLGLALALYVPGYRRCHGLVPSGDDLFDEYARAVRDRQATRLFYVSFPDGGLNPVVLPDDMLAAWEPRYGRDPRYWQLRCWNAASQNLPSLVAWDWPHVEYGNSAAFLEEARLRQVADAATLELLGWMRGCQAFRLEQGAKPLPGEVPPHELRVEQRQLLDEAVAADPQRAWPHYRLALRACECGDLAQSARELALGNVAPDTTHIALFPRQLLMNNLNHGHPLANPALSYYLLQSQACYDADWPGVQPGLRALADSALAAGDMQLLTTVQLAWCRMGSSCGESEYSANYFAHQVRRTIRQLLLERGDKLSRPQREVALWLNDAMRSTLHSGDTTTFDRTKEAMLEQDGARWLALLPPLGQERWTEIYMRQNPPDSAPGTLLEHLEDAQSINYALPDFGLSVLQAARARRAEQ